MDDLCPRQQVAYRATSSSFVPNISMSTLDFRHDCNSEGMGPPFSHFNASTQYNTVMVDNTDPYCFIRGKPVRLPAVAQLNNLIVCTFFLQVFIFMSNNLVSNLL